MKKVSFDFDTTLRMPDGSINPDGMALLMEHRLNPNSEIIIVTSRHGDMNSEHNSNMFEFLFTNDLLDLKVFFTNGFGKLNTLRGLGVDIHFDDDQWEVEDINADGNVIAIQVPFDHELWIKLMCN